MNQEGPKKIIAERLHFGDEQTVHYEDLIRQHQSRIRSLNDSINIAKNNLYHSLTTQNFAGKDTFITRLGVLQREVELTHYDHFVSIKMLCKPNQVVYFNNLTNELAMFFEVGKDKGQLKMKPD